MITGRADGDDGKVLLLLGLSAENIARLVGGQPIRLSRKSHGMAVPENLTIFIITGETEDTIATDLTRLGLIGPTTVLNQKEPQ